MLKVEYESLSIPGLADLPTIFVTVLYYWCNFVYTGCSSASVYPSGLFPYVNFATFKGPVERIVKDMTEPTQELVQALIEGHGLPGHQINHPGKYITAVVSLYATL